MWADNISIYTAIQVFMDLYPCLAVKDELVTDKSKSVELLKVKLALTLSWPLKFSEPNLDISAL